MNAIRFRELLLLFCVCASLTGAASAQEHDEPIRAWPQNPRYWEYRGRPVLLLGGSDDDNLFQRPDLKDHLDEMKAVGANYIRNTMSDRPDKGFEDYPFKRLADGKYDLAQFNDAYWAKFANMLEWTYDRDIIVQIEVWDRFDYTDAKGLGAWQKHPYNPANNVNYTYDESGFAKEYPDHPGANKQPFFYTVAKGRENRVVLKFQEAFVRKMLEHSLKYPHVLYCMDNETSGEEEWGRYWAQFIKHQAEQAGRPVCVTEMWDDWDVKGGRHKQTYDHPNQYDFVDISQNNHNKGDAHWDNLHWVIDYLKQRPRPINTVKIYGADTGRFGNDRDGVERFWRNIVGGCAATRFHRPDSGQGLNDRAKASLKAARLVESHVRAWNVVPAMALLSDRSDNEAYLAADAGKTYLLYFTDGGKVTLDLTTAPGTFSIFWVDIAQGQEIKPLSVEGGKQASIAAPGKGGWAAVLVRDGN